MKKITLTLAVICSTLFAKSQIHNVDSLVATLNLTGEHDPEILADTLTSSFKTDSEKVRAIYYWIGHNIGYDCHAFHLAKSNYNYNELYDERDARTLSKRKGVCEDYAALFYSMCKEAGVKCVVLTGYGAYDLKAAISMNSDGVLNLTHAWDAVKINGTWRLVDPTWASGYCDENVTKFTRAFTYSWFMVPAKEFLLSHFPDDSQWELINTPLDLKSWIKFVKKSYSLN